MTRLLITTRITRFVGPPIKGRRHREALSRADKPHEVDHNPRPPLPTASGGAPAGVLPDGRGGVAQCRSIQVVEPPRDRSQSIDQVDHTSWYRDYVPHLRTNWNRVVKVNPEPRTQNQVYVSKFSLWQVYISKFSPETYVEGAFNRKIVW